jgi:hypothetical protein
MLIVEFADLEIGSAAERYRTSMAKYLPKPLRTPYRGGRARAVNGFARRNGAGILCFDCDENALQPSALLLTCSIQTSFSGKL